MLGGTAEALMHRAIPIVLMGLALPFAAEAQQAFDRRAEFAKLVTDFQPHQSALYARHRALVQEVQQREKLGERAICAHQILSEAEWLIGYTVDYDRIDARLADADAALA